MIYSTDDMGWLCNWGGIPLLPWETIGTPPLRADDPCVVSHFEQWMYKENIHIYVTAFRDSKMLRPLNEHELVLLHMYATDVRFARNDAMIKL